MERVASSNVLSETSSGHQTNAVNGFRSLIMHQSLENVRLFHGTNRSV